MEKKAPADNKSYLSNGCCEVYSRVLGKSHYSVISMILFHILGDKIISPTNVLTIGPKINMEKVGSKPAKNME